jgi:hypothetical protein
VPPGPDPPLAYAVLVAEVALDVGPGRYALAAELQRGGAPAAGRRALRLSPEAPRLDGLDVALLGVAEPTAAWLRGRGARCRPLDTAALERRELILVGDLAGGPADVRTWRALATRLARGGFALFLSPRAFAAPGAPLHWLPLEEKGCCASTLDYNYTKECVARAHAAFDGLQAPGILDWEDYGTVIGPLLFQGQRPPDETICAGFVVGHANFATRYVSGIALGEYRLGAGAFVLNTLRLAEHLGTHPAADRLLANLLRHGAARTAAPLEPSPPDLEARLRGIGYA